MLTQGFSEEQTVWIGATEELRDKVFVLWFVTEGLQEVHTYTHALPCPAQDWPRGKGQGKEHRTLESESEFVGGSSLSCRRLFRPVE